MPTGLAWLTRCRHGPVILVFCTQFVAYVTAEIGCKITLTQLRSILKFTFHFKMASCAVYSCPNTYSTCKNAKNGEERVTFHRLPKDLGHQKHWIKICKIVNHDPKFLANVKVCSDHFTTEDFTTFGNKVKIRACAIPSRKTPVKSKESSLFDLVNELNVKITKLEKENTLLKSKLEVADNALSKLFSPVQVNMLKKDLIKTYWTPIEMAKCIELKSISQKAYEKLKTDWKLPIPCSRTIERWVSEIKFQPGILSSILSLLKEQFSSASIQNRQVILAYDEMSVDSSVCYDPKEDHILGPHKKVLVVAIRGLFQAWKQPVYYSFDTKLSSSILNEIIAKVQDSGLNVVGMVSDLAPTNRGLWLDYGGITEKKPYFRNVVTGERIWVFADYPHLIKLLRNNIMDHGFKLKNGKTVLRSDFQEVVDANKTELKACYKITQKHLDVIGRERMNVRMAFEILSKSVATCFEKFTGKEHIAKFVHLVNNASDILNSRVPNPKNIYKCAYGSYISEQDKILDEFVTEIKAMRAFDAKLKSGIKNTMMPFQKGILITVASLQGLYKQMNSNSFSTSYILTARLNQDFIENIFSSVRGLGIFNQNPSPIECKYRLKSLAITRSLALPKKLSVASDYHCEEEMLQNEVLSCLKTSSVTNSMDFDRDWPAEAAQALAVSHIMEFDEECGDISPENWEEFCASITVSEECEFGGQEYICGYIASKVKDIPGLELPHPERSRNPQSWMQQISRGNLTTPSYPLLNVFRKMNLNFLHYHSTGEKWHINRSIGVMENLKVALSLKFPDISEKIITLFVRTRTHIRIKYLNSLIKAKRSQAVYLQRVLGSNA